MKKTVYYEVNKENIISEGMKAYVKPVDHPNCSNKNFVLTSVVIKHNKITGDFETHNTLYRPSWVSTDQWIEQILNLEE